MRKERILNRGVGVTNERPKMEADQRHADIIIAILNLKAATGVTSPSGTMRRTDMFQKARTAKHIAS